MFGTKIKLDKDLLERCKKFADETGYSSVEEFIVHALEKELRSRAKRSEETGEEIKNKLKGLGYID
jgi:metal-responsive CopG/Arc/MetJ family transcriptional regulator